MKRFSISLRHRIPIRQLACLVLLSLAAIGCAQETPAGYEQLLPRGKIAAIDQPTYVPADEASLSDDCPVLGAVVDGVPVAFSLKLLNRHEVVNDSIGDTNFAAVW